MYVDSTLLKLNGCDSEAAGIEVLGKRHLSSMRTGREALEDGFLLRIKLACFLLRDGSLHSRPPIKNSIGRVPSRHDWP